jgi:predicted MPP superfamily phosphohydrolase
LHFFRLAFFTLFAGLNFGVAGLLVHLMRRRQPWPRVLGFAVWTWAVVIVGVMTFQLLTPPSWQAFWRTRMYLPLSIEMVWNLLFVQLVFLTAIVATLVLGRARKVDRAVPMTPQDISRRRFIYLAACGAAPATAVALGVHGYDIRHDLRLRELDVPVSNLPPELEGFTIAHVSDLHSGIFCGPERLRKIGDATNDLKADLIVITGDVVNGDVDHEFAPAAEMIRRLESRHGLFLCEGNHDIFSGAPRFGAACRDAGFALLRNSGAVVPVGNSRLVLGGLPWFSRSYRGRAGFVESLFPSRREGDLRLLLVHHPNLFDASAASADLVLSGHTHGGQIMVGGVGFGPLFFEYWSGLYRRGASTLVVSNGAGDWFPCRVGAPAEIGRLRLTRAV